MSNPDDFNDMMRRMGVKPMGKDGVRPTTRRRAKGAEKSTPSPAPGTQPTGSDEQADALQAQVATLEAQIEENQAASSVAQEQWTAERTKLEAEIERLEEEVAANQLQQQVVRLCDDCPRLTGVMMIKVDGSVCDACGGTDLRRALRRFLDACLINGRLRVAIVGRDASAHALLRAIVQDNRLQLTQFPVPDKNATRVAVEVAGQDAAVLWGPGADALARGSADRMVRVGPVSVAVMLDAAGVAIAQDVDGQ